MESINVNITYMFDGIEVDLPVSVSPQDYINYIMERDGLTADEAEKYFKEEVEGGFKDVVKDDSDFMCGLKEDNTNEARKLYYEQLEDDAILDEAEKEYRHMVEVESHYW